MNITDRYCLDLFPELLELYGIDALEQASSLGSYVFHEDFFNEFLIKRSDSDDIMFRGAKYIAYLFADENTYLNDLAQIGILEGLINCKFSRIAPFLERTVPRSTYKMVVMEARTRIRFDIAEWLSSE